MDIVFFVLAGVAPMGVVVALTVLAIALGNGAGVPGTYLIAGVVLALFAVGYVRMSARITNVGAFYRTPPGTGHRVGGATAYIAVLAYNAATIGIFGALAYFANQVRQRRRDRSPVAGVGAIAFAIVAVLSYFEVTLSAKVLGVALLREVGAARLRRRRARPQRLPRLLTRVFKPSIVFGAGFGVRLMLAFGSFVGFEATALYGEEARTRAGRCPAPPTSRSPPSRCFTCSQPGRRSPPTASTTPRPPQRADPTGFIFAANAKYVGGFTIDAMQILVVTSLFAAFLAFHCNTARYHFALARDGLLPGRSPTPTPSTAPRSSPAPLSSRSSPSS